MTRGLPGSFPLMARAEVYFPNATGVADVAGGGKQLLADVDVAKEGILTMVTGFDQDDDGGPTRCPMPETNVHVASFAIQYTPGRRNDPNGPGRWRRPWNGPSGEGSTTWDS